MLSQKGYPKTRLTGISGIFGAGGKIINIYQAILRKVHGGRAMKYKFRGGTPVIAGILQMKFTMPEEEIVQFESVLLRNKERALQKILDRHTPRTEEIISMCSWCSRINLNDDWCEVTEASLRLKVSANGSLPQISHGMCEDCYEIVSKEFMA